MRAALDLAEMAAILAAVGLLGIPLVRGIPGLSRAEVAAWAWIAGLLALACAEGSLLLVALRPDPWKLWGLLAVSSFAFRCRKSAALPSAPAATAESQGPGLASRIGKLAWTLALAGFVLYSIQAVSEPMWAWDFVAIWGLKGKVLYLSGGLPARYFHDPQLAFLHPSYPLLLPVLFAALSTLAGSWDSQALALLYPGFELATILLLWGFLRRRAGVAGASVAIVLTAGFFSLYQTYLTGLAEIPIALGFGLAGTALLDALDSDRAPRWRPILLAAVFCTALKKEATAFLLLLAVAAILGPIAGRRRERLRFAAIPAAIFLVVPLLQTALLRLLRGPVLDPSLRWAALPEIRADVLAQRLGETGSYVLHSVVFPSLPALLAVAVIFACTRRGIADRLLFPLAALTGLYALAPALSTWSDPSLMAGATFPRVVSALVPVLFLVLGARISASADRFSLRFSSEGTKMN